MDKILVKPSLLRTNAQTLRSKAKTINAALTSVEKLVHELDNYKFSGNRATSVRTRFTKTHEQLINASSLICAFAKDLEESAALFERADKGEQNVLYKPGDPVTKPGIINIVKQTTKTSEQPALRDNGSTDLTKTYDGKTFAKGTYNSKDSYSARPVNPPLTNEAGNRSVDNYQAVLNEFGVETNPRYLQRNGNTYCNIFVWDATKAMGAEIPHWVNSSGDAVDVGKGSELSANGVVNWLNNHGSENGWHEISAVEAQSMANDGKPTVAVWGNSRGIGHVAMVRPGEYSSNNGPLISQAGGVNTNTGSVSQNFSTAWKKDQMQYFAHD